MAVIDAGAVIVRILSDTRGLTAGLTSASGQVSAFSRKTSKAGAALTKGLTLPMVGVGVVAAKMAYDFNESLDKINVLVGASGKQMDRYRESILKLSGQTAKAPKELADALYFITSSGFKGASALKVLTAAAKASAAGLGDTATIADAVTSAVNAYGEKSLSAAKATDVLLAAVREGKSEPEEFAAAIGRVIPIAETMGVSFGEVAGAMAALSLNGTDANEAVTQITAGLAQAIKPTKEGADALKRIGMTYGDLRKEIADKGLLQTFDDLKQKFGGNIESLAEVFGNIRALRGALTLTGPAMEKYAGIVDRVTKANGDTAAAFEKVSETSGHKMRQALADLQVAGVNVGDKLLPILADLAGHVSKAADAFSKLSPGTQGLIVKAGLAVAAVGPLLSMMARLSTIKLAFGGAEALGGLAGNAGKATRQINLLGDAALTTGKGLRGMTVGTAAGLGIIGVAAGSLLVVLTDISAETDRIYEGVDKMADANTEAINKLGAKQLYAAAVEGVNSIVKAMADHKMSLEEGQDALLGWNTGLQTALASAKKWGTPEQVRGIKDLIKLTDDLGASADGMRAKLGKPIRMHNTELNADIASTKTRIGELKDRITALGLLKPTPEVKADIADAERKLKKAQDKLRALNREKASPKVTVNNTGALSALDAVIHRMSQIRDKTVRVMVLHNSGAGPLPAHLTGGTSTTGGRRMSMSGAAEPWSNAPFGSVAYGGSDFMSPKAMDQKWATINAMWDKLAALQNAAEQVQQDILSLTKTIMGTVDLWPKYVETVDELGNKVRELALPTIEVFDPADLGRVMDANVANMREWVANMDKLRAAGLPKELLDELTAMGLGGAGQVAGLAAMTAEQLAKWTGGWLELQKLAGQQAQKTYQDAAAAAGKALSDFTVEILKALAKLRGTPWATGTSTPGTPGTASSGTIPTMASGGIVTRRTLAMIGEGANAEAVIPLPSNWRTNQAGGFGGDVYNTTVDARGSTDPAATAAAVKRAVILAYAEAHRASGQGRGR